ncbi:thioredoxin family protein [Sabulibacter ruber]|uniref:thioredoxin family protein n=1 Tax=Sabulibacter ruber TaxID=2811901 RepID=UPI001A960C3C|nr:thioredoxin family protein [Sabulibacter ruber]
MRSFIAILFLFFALDGLGQEVPMHTDWGKAKELAAREQKNILIVLTGSEWCSPCKKMDKDVFAHPQFQKYAKDHLVVFLVDLPKNLVMNSVTYKNYEQFKSRYQASALPSLILTSSDGKKIRLLNGKMFRLENVMAQLQSNPAGS